MKIFPAGRRLPPWLNAIAAEVVRGYGKTLRVAVQDPAAILQAAVLPPCIFLVWHNRILGLPSVLPRPLLRQMSFLASRSKDGGYTATLLAHFGVRAVRGSSSRGGAMALRAMRAHLVAGRSLWITPDGPRGPRYEPHDGALWLASSSGCPLVLVTLNTRCHWEAKSWDGFQVPLPFSRAQFQLSERIAVAASMTAASLPQWRELVRTRLLALTHWDHATPAGSAVPDAPH